jgi:serine/threonine protein kinase
MATAGSHSEGDDDRAARPIAPPRFRAIALASTLVDPAALDVAEADIRLILDESRVDPGQWDNALAQRLVEMEVLTPFQAKQMLAGRRKLTLGQYRILELLGQGGMGQVFRAEHALMGREVAVKVLPRAKSTPTTEAAFRREIRMLGRLDHENLVRALDAGHDGKVSYLVTELISGCDLRKQVIKYGTLDETLAACIAVQVAKGLAYAHGQGLVHRDVKPGNILVSDQGRAKLLDVGLAGSVLEAESTRLGRVVGTMDYMAPEQIRSADSAGPAADIYGLGCTLYFCLSGQVPFPGGTRQDKARRQLQDEPQPLHDLAPTVSNRFCALVAEMMRKDPAARIATANEAIERLSPWLVTPQPPLPRTPRGRGQRPERPAGAVRGSRANASRRSSDFDQRLLDEVLSPGAPSDPQGLDSGTVTPPLPLPLAPVRARRHDPGIVEVFKDARRWFWRTGVGRITVRLPQSIAMAGTVGIAFGVAVSLGHLVAPVLAVRVVGQTSAATLGCTVFAVLLGLQCLVALFSADGESR